jgi:hydrogenase nickel insertion protein HypA
MHEYAMTKQIVDSIIVSAESNRAQKVPDVYVAIGKFTFLNPVQIRFWFNLLKKENPMLISSKLHVKSKEGVVQCDQCGYRGKIKYVDDPTYHLIIPTLECPKCKSTVAIVEGKECKIESIKVVI